MVCVCKCVSVRGCAYASESVGGCAAKNGKGRKVLLEAISERRSGDKKSDGLCQFTK